MKQSRISLLTKQAFAPARQLQSHNNFQNKDSNNKLRKKNIFFRLTVVTLLVSCAVALLPWIPELRWVAQHRISLPQTSIATETKTDQSYTAEFNLNQGDYLLIPKIEVASPIYEGSSEGTLKKGIWRVPNSSNPALGSNTVLTAHRFQYTFGPQTFYHLDKLVVGDRMYVYWQGKEYMYEVSETFAVSDTTVEIEQPTDERILTLYTCELFDMSKRLVVKANLKSTMQVGESQAVKTEVAKVATGE